MTNPSLPELTQKLTAFFSQRDVVLFAYIFGSLAKGTGGPSSDLDVAVYLKEDLSADQRFDSRLKLMGEISSILHADNIDLIVLNDSPLALRYSVIYQGIILDEKDASARIHFEAKSMSLFFDRQYYDQRHIQLNLENIAKGGL